VLKAGIERGGWGGLGKGYGAFWVLWLLCVFGCISSAAVDGACVSDYRGLEMCMFHTVG
jgi:hypothetical protein